MPDLLPELIEKVALLDFLWDYSQGIIIILVVKDLADIVLPSKISYLWL